MNRTTALIAAAAAIFTASRTNAALTIYTDRTAWAAAAGPHQTETFESFTDFTELPQIGGTFVTPAFDIVVDANHGRIGVDNGADGVYETPYLTGAYFVGDVHSPEWSRPHFNTLVFHQPITAFAANFGALDDRGIDDVRVAGESFRISPFGPGGYLSNFFGVVSTTPFSEVDIRNANDKLERYGMDDVSYVTVPEPSAVLLAVASTVAVVARRKSWASRSGR
ncbi:hypothetical protein [Lacipirellula sp.]|uniref:hypothetical protein n=1 Tax=Lacipirellula sp. TaxID=2691419 RepID=UPI003D0DCE33